MQPLTHAGCDFAVASPIRRARIWARRSTSLANAQCASAALKRLVGCAHLARNAGTGFPFCTSEGGLGGSESLAAGTNLSFRSDD